MPPNIDDIMEEHEDLKEAANTDAISQGEKGQPYGGSHLARQAELIPYTDEVVRDKDKQKDAYRPRKGVQNVLASLGELLQQELHVNVAAVKADLGDAKADDDGQGLADDFKSAQDRVTEGAQNYIADGQEHHEGEGRSSDMIKDLNYLNQNAEGTFCFSHASTTSSGFSMQL